MNHTLALSLLAASALLAGCAPQLVSVSDKTIVVRARPADRAEAQDIAETQCLQRGLHARAVSRPADNQFGFECVR